MRFRRVTLADALLARAGCTQSQWGFPRTPVAAVNVVNYFRNLERIGTWSIQTIK